MKSPVFSEFSMNFISRGLFVLIALCLLQNSESHAAESDSFSADQFLYFPEGEAIVTERSRNDYNRPLYCNKIFPTIYTGDRPRIGTIDWNGSFGQLEIALHRGQETVWLHDFKEIKSEYFPGRIEWTLTDERFSDLKIKMSATTMATRAGFVVRVTSEGATPEDELLWFYGRCFTATGLFGCFGGGRLNTVADEKNTPFELSFENVGFDIKLIDPAKYIQSPPPLRIIGRFDVPVTFKKMDGNVRPPEVKDLLKPKDEPKDQGVCARMKLSALNPIHFALYLDTITNRPYSIYEGWDGAKFLTPKQLDSLERKFDQSIQETPATAFNNGWENATKIGRQAVVESPDSYLNAMVGASCTAAYGLHVAPVFVHGGSRWRIQMPGWRMLDGAIAFGWNQLVKEEAKYYLPTMIKSSPLTIPKTDPKHKGGTQQVKDSRFYGKGRIAIDMSYYNFQTQFMDGLVRSWRHTADPELEALLLPSYELHLEWVKDCFDPDNDGLYESYLNLWPTDNVGYNGGGSVEESAYTYNILLAAADMCQRKGDKEGEARHRTQAKKIDQALHDILWVKRKGHFASYLEQGGHKRVNEDGWLYSQFLPIDLGIATPAESIRTLHFTEWGLERIPLHGGEMCVTSNWVPSTYSVRELYGGDNFQLALTYFQMGQSDAGYKLLKAAFMESGYGGIQPIASYGKIDTVIPYNGNTNSRSPGGLSNPKCGIDFADILTQFCRATVEGLFGYVPDYPNGRVKIQPSFPTDWDHASLTMDSYQLKFKREGNVDRYEIGLKTPAEMLLRLPIYAKRLLSATVNGQAVKVNLQPWYGYGMVMIRIPKESKETKVEVVLNLEGRQKPVMEKTLQAVSGEEFTLLAEGPIEKIDDDQGFFVKPTIEMSKVVGRCSEEAGYYAVMGLVKSEVPYWKVWKIKLANPEKKRLSDVKNLRKVDPQATWKPLEITSVANGDLRTIFKQDYASPRPNTTSIRVARNGYQLWTMLGFNHEAPEIGLENLFGSAASLLKNGVLMTPQGAPFAVPTEARNIAFTSLWDNWPAKVTLPVGQSAEAIWLLIAGSTFPNEGRIPNSVLCFRYEDGIEERLELIPPFNFRNLCRVGICDYNPVREAFSLGDTPPLMVQLGTECRAMLYGWKLREGVKLKEVTLETLSQNVVVGLMGLSLMNPK